MVLYADHLFVDASEPLVVDFPGDPSPEKASSRTASSDIQEWIHFLSYIPIHTFHFINDSYSL